MKKKQIIILSIILVFIGCSVCLALFYKEQSVLSESEAKKITDRFFTYFSLKDTPSEMIELYPSYHLINERLYIKENINGNWEIDRIIEIDKSSSEIFVSYKRQNKDGNVDANIPVVLKIKKENGKVFIESSKGISYSHYNKLKDYGKKLGLLYGNETDVELELIIKEHNLKNQFETEIKNMFIQIENKIKVTANLEIGLGGIINGNIVVVNNNDIALNVNDIECSILLYNESNKLVDTYKPQFFYGYIRPYQSMRDNVFITNSSNSTNYTVNKKLLSSNNLREIIAEHLVK